MSLDRRSRFDNKPRFVPKTAHRRDPANRNMIQNENTNNYKGIENKGEGEMRGKGDVDVAFVNRPFPSLYGI